MHFQNKYETSDLAQCLGNHITDENVYMHVHVFAHIFIKTNIRYHLLAIMC